MAFGAARLVATIYPILECHFEWRNLASHEYRCPPLRLRNQRRPGRNKSGRADVKRLEQRMEPRYAVTWAFPLRRNVAVPQWRGGRPVREPRRATAAARCPCRHSSTASCGVQAAASQALNRGGRQQKINRDNRKYAPDLRNEKTLELQRAGFGACLQTTGAIAGGGAHHIGWLLWPGWCDDTKVPHAREEKQP